MDREGTLSPHPLSYENRVVGDNTPPTRDPSLTPNREGCVRTRTEVRSLRG